MTQTHPRTTPTPARIVRPDVPEHFMELEPVRGLCEAWVGSTRVASSRRALRLWETAGRSLPPVIYFPPNDVRSDLLVPADKTTRCPLKGTASYFDILAEGRIEGAAWQYQSTLTFDVRLAQIECCVAFAGESVRVSAEREGA